MEKAKILTLNLCKEYFEEILSDRKKEEYRQIKPYWDKRLNKKYDFIVIRCGYPKKEDKTKEIIFKWKGYIKKKIIHKHFGNKPIEVYAIILDEKINKTQEEF